jgi:hypothetical protein
MRPPTFSAFIYLLFGAAWLSFSACEQIPSNPEPTIGSNKSQSSHSEEETIPLRMTTVSTSLSFQPQDFDRQALSDTHVRELKTWWDSLPQPLRAQVQTNQVTVQVVSNIRADSALSLDTRRTDTQIEQTGAALEQVVGSPVKDMTYTVNTSNDKEQLATTEISLVATVPVKLSQFGLDMSLSANADLSDKNLQTLQFWWSNLPMDLQSKIQAQEILLHLELVQIAANEHSVANNLKLAQNQCKLNLYTEVLNRIIGTNRIGKMEIPMALVQTQQRQEQSSEQNQHFKDNQYLKIQLRTNKKNQPVLNL